jgi:hypothetical protein
MSEERRAVTPIRPAAAYIGGKRRLGELLARPSAEPLPASRDLLSL